MGGTLGCVNTHLHVEITINATQGSAVDGRYSGFWLWHVNNVLVLLCVF